MIIPGAEPFFLPGGSTGCLLIHGFTGTPKEMRSMGEYLADKGHSVFGIRLAGHATRPEDLNRTRWQDWVASVEDGYHTLHGEVDSIFVMGLSMGGTLSLLFSTLKPVDGVVAISTPYTLPADPRLPFAEYLHRMFPSVSKGPSDWHDLEAANDHIEYPSYPTRAIVELRALISITQVSLSQVQVPVLLAHSKNDGSIPAVNMQRIYDNLGSTNKQMMWIENSGHVITREPERMRIFQAAENFIQRIVISKNEP